ncbi:MAG: ATPase, T2SS/T4P/T4SS family [Patescibacteria group bacterium]|jgi:type II secretory ATPase GspE/PulE/Tfp pilus assembly ATPase PilB-like protein
MDKKIINKLLKQAQEYESLNLAIEENDSGHLSVNYLLPSGQRRVLGLPPKLEADLKASIQQVLNLTPGELINKKYFKLQGPKEQFNFWLTVAPQGNGERFFIQIASKQPKCWRLNQLGFDRQSLKVLTAAIKKRQGLILVSAPDNQGKSTTLGTLVKEIDRPDISAYYFHSGPGASCQFTHVNQVVNNSTNWEKIMKLDSEVLIIEISNQLDLINALRAGASGRLVLASIKAHSSWQALDYCLKAPLPLTLKNNSLQLIINQRLAPLRRQQLAAAEQKINQRDTIGVFELLPLTPKIQDFITLSSQEKNKLNFWNDLSRLANQQGFLPLKKDFANKKRFGLIL